MIMHWSAVALVALFWIHKKVRSSRREPEVLQYDELDCGGCEQPLPPAA